MYYFLYYTVVHKGVQMSKNLSIRKIPSELERAIQIEAKKSKTNKTQVVIKALRQAFNLEESPTKIQRDVRKFFGKMTLKDYQEFQKQTQSFSSLDEDMWK